MKSTNMKSTNMATFFILFALGCIVGSMIAAAFGHSAEDCFDVECAFVQVETSGGGIEMVYVCE